MNQRKIIVSVVAIVLLCVATKWINTIVSSTKKKPEPKVTVVSDPLVKVQTVANMPVMPQLITEGKFTSSEQISVSLEGKGTLQSAIDLKEGSIFKKGQRIAYVIDEQTMASYNASMSKYHQVLTSAMVDIEMEYPEFTSKWQDFSNQIKQNKLPKLPLENNSRLSNYLSSKGVFNGYYELKAQQNALTKRSFYAPFDGFVLTVLLQNGSFVNGTSKICEIAPLNKLEVDFSIDQQFAESVKIGSKVSINNAQATIIRVGQKISNVTQQKIFTAQLINNTNQLLVGEFVKIVVPLSKNKVEASLIPAFCLNKENVFLVQKGNTLTTQKITVVGERNDSVYVTGLKNKDVILLEAYSNFNSNQKVRLK